MPNSITIDTLPPRTERGRHDAFHQDLLGEYEFIRTRRRARTRQGYFDLYHEATTALQALIGDAVQHQTGLRARGALWSLNKSCVTDGHLIDNKRLRLIFPMPKSELSATYTRDDPQKNRRLWFVECGASIGYLNNVLYAHGQTLKAAGTNNGQSIVGAFSTNTHGSAFRFGSTPDFVVGLHLLTGQNKHIYLERASYPVVRRGGFVPRLGPGVQFIQDDALFNAALVSFGSMGIIHGVMIETADLRLLHTVRFARPYDQTLKDAITAADPAGLALPPQAQHVPTGSPYHFEVILNPNAGTAPDHAPDDAYVLMLFEDRWDRASYDPPPWDDDQSGPGATGLQAMGRLLEILPSFVTKPLLNDQVANRFRDEVDTGVIKDLFRGERIVGKALAAGMGMSPDRVVEALDIMFQRYAAFGTTLPMLFDLRFVKATQATLGFTRFDPTCIVEIDAINTPNARRYLRDVWNHLHQAQIPFTLHWGKLNDYLTSARVQQMYGPAREAWITAREQLLDDPATRRVFNNAFLEKAGLAT